MVEPSTPPKSVCSLEMTACFRRIWSDTFWGFITATRLSASSVNSRLAQIRNRIISSVCFGFGWTNVRYKQCCGSGSGSIESKTWTRIIRKSYLIFWEKTFCVTIVANFSPYKISSSNNNLDLKLRKEIFFKSWIFFNSSWIRIQNFEKLSQDPGAKLTGSATLIISQQGTEKFSHYI